MTVFIDNRGYAYLGDQLNGVALVDAYGTIEHSSSVNGAATSEMGTALNTVLGAGKWGIAANISTSWGVDIADATVSVVDLLWTPAATIGRPAIDINTYATGGSSAGINDSNGGSFMFGFRMKGNSDPLNVFIDTSAANDGSFRISPVDNFFYNHTSLSRIIYASVTPNSVGIFAVETSGSNPRFLYQCVLEGSFLQEPYDRFSMACTTTFSGANRPLLKNVDNFEVVMRSNDAVYSSALALNPNATGDPYVTPYYAIDNDTDIGSYQDVAVGLCPDLFIYHAGSLSEGDVVNMADLNVSGNYILGTLDNSDATHAICVRTMSGSRRLMMRIGNAS